MKKGALLQEYAAITLGTLIVSAAVYFFLIPSQVTVGSITGLVVLISNFLPFRISVMTFVLNTLLLILGFFTIGREFGGKTVYTSILMPVFLGALEELFPNQQSLTGDSFLDMIGYIFVVSIGLAILFNLNASSGGLDIVAKILNKYLHIELGKAMTIAGMCTALTSVFAYEPKIVFLSVLGTYLNGVVLDHFILGFNTRKRVCIISEKQEELLRFLTEEMHSGATLYEATGAYNRQKRTEIITIVNRNEYSKLLNWLHREDPNAFVTVYTVGEIIRSNRANPA
ncbi:MAG TPA: YitT family protein [Ruminococcaceae bacterium]|nr:YitT family protein [Oscillospiraceae bacterium]